MISARSAFFLRLREVRLPIRATCVALAAIALALSNAVLSSSMPRLSLLQNKDPAAESKQQDPPATKAPIEQTKPELMPAVINPKPAPAPAKPVEQPPTDAKPAEESKAAAQAGVAVPFRTRTGALEVVGGAVALVEPATAEEFRPVRVATSSLEVVGNAAAATAESAAPAAPFSPIRVRTDALEVVARGTGE